MFYEKDITVLTTHTSTNKLKESLILTQGVIERIAISFPPGCQNLIHITINTALHQIFPTNPDGTIKADGYVVEGEPFILMFAEPYIVDVYGWGVSANYDHTITIRIWLKRLWQMLPYSDEMYNLMIKEGEI